MGDKALGSSDDCNGMVAADSTLRWPSGKGENGHASKAPETLLGMCTFLTQIFYN